MCSGFRYGKKFRASNICQSLASRVALGDDIYDKIQYEDCLNCFNAISDRKRVVLLEAYAEPLNSKVHFQQCSTCKLNLHGTKNYLKGIQNVEFLEMVVNHHLKFQIEKSIIELQIELLHWDILHQSESL